MVSKKTVSFLGKEVTVSIPSKEFMERCVERYLKNKDNAPVYDCCRLGSEFYLHQGISTQFGNQDDGTKFFSVKTFVLLGDNKTIYGNEKSPVSIDEITKVSQNEIDRAIEAIPLNVYKLAHDEKEAIGEVGELSVEELFTRRLCHILGLIYHN